MIHDYKEVPENSNFKIEKIPFDKLECPKLKGYTVVIICKILFGEFKGFYVGEACKVCHIQC